MEETIFTDQNAIHEALQRDDVRSLRVTIKTHPPESMTFKGKYTYGAEIKKINIGGTYRDLITIESLTVVIPPPRKMTITETQQP